MHGLMEKKQFPTLQSRWFGENHEDDCYFCLVNITGFNAYSRKKMKYLNLPSAMRLIPHSDNLTVTILAVNKNLLSSSDEEMPSKEDSS